MSFRNVEKTLDISAPLLLLLSVMLACIHIKYDDVACPRVNAMSSTGLKVCHVAWIHVYATSHVNVTLTVKQMKH